MRGCDFRAAVLARYARTRRLIVRRAVGLPMGCMEVIFFVVVFFCVNHLAKNPPPIQLLLVALTYYRTHRTGLASCVSAASELLFLSDALALVAPSSGGVHAP